MADVKLRIEVNSDAETEMLGKVSLIDESKNSNTGLQTTNKIYNKIPSIQIQGVEGLSLAKGYLVFNKDGYLANEDTQTGTLQSEEEPVEFVWGATDENGNYELILNFSNCRNLDKIVIYGDNTANQFPIEGYLDSETEPITSDDGKWAIKFEKAASSHSIRFTKWNRPNYNAVITLIKVMLRYLDVDKFNGLKTVESLSQSTGQPKTLYYGIVPNTGSMEVLDIHGEIADLIESEIIPNSNLKVQLLANGRQVQEHITTDSDYNTTTKIFTGDLSDELSQWGKLEYAGYTYQNTSKTAYELITHVLRSVGYSVSQIDEMLSENILFGNENVFGSVKSYLQKITIKYGFLYADNIRNTIEKFCRLAQMQVYKRDDGKIRFVSARPIVPASQVDNALSIPKGSQSKPFSKAVVLKNKYEAVEIIEKKVTDSIDYNTLIANSKTTDISNAIHVSDTDTDSWTNSVQNFNYELKGYIDAWFSEITCTFKANSVDNFEQILNVAENATKYYLSFDDGTSGTIDNFSYSYTYTRDITQSISVSVSNQSTIGNSGTITYNEATKEYTAKFVVPTRIRKRTTYKSNSNSSSTNMAVTVDEIDKKATQVEISVYGNKRVIKFNDNVVSDENVSQVSTFASVENSELLQDETMFEGIKMSELIKTNIKNDYKNGVSNGNLTIPCVDIYDKKGLLIKDWWNNGSIVETNEILAIHGDKGNWRVIGRKFKKSGAPNLDLEVQEVRKLEREPLVYDGGLYSDSSYTTMTASWQDMINDGTVVLSEDCFVLNSVNTSINGYLKIDSNIYEISSSACKNCTGLLGVDLVNVNTIGRSAFSGCTNLSSIITTTKLQTIEGSAFLQCSSLSSITFPSDLRTIGDSAFEGCSSLTSIAIPDSVTIIGGYAFGDCTSLKNISIGAGVSTLENVFANCTALTSIVVPGNILSIDSTFFNCTSLIEVTLSEGLQRIGSYTFENTHIYDITIPSTVYEIGDSAFAGCSYLDTATFSRTTGWRASDNVQYYEVTLTGPSRNATYLTETYPCHWYNDEIG